MVNIILGIIFSACMLGWLLFFSIKGMILAKKAMCERTDTIEVTCTKCERTFQATVKDLITTSRLQKKVWVYTPNKHVYKVQRKCPCPYCESVEWVKVNVEQLSVISREVEFPILTKYLAIAFVPPLIIGQLLMRFM